MLALEATAGFSSGAGREAFLDILCRCPPPAQLLHYHVRIGCVPSSDTLQWRAPTSDLCGCAHEYSIWTSRYFTGSILVFTRCGLHPSLFVCLRCIDHRHDDTTRCPVTVSPASGFSSSGPKPGHASVLAPSRPPKNGPLVVEFRGPYRICTSANGERVSRRHNSTDAMTNGTPKR